MKLTYISIMAIAALWIAGCSSLPGLRVLTGEDTGENAQNRVVEELDLVMADKSGATDPSLLSAADRIEAASGLVDIIEIRPDTDADEFSIHMLFRPPQVPQTLEGQVMMLDALRRTLEITWMGVMPESEGSDMLHVTLLDPYPVTTLGSGDSFVGFVYRDVVIGRDDAAQYLSGERNLNNFYGLILNGVLVFNSPEASMLYEGSPNHPTFMLAQLQQAQAAQQAQ